MGCTPETYGKDDVCYPSHSLSSDIIAIWIAVAIRGMIGDECSHLTVSYRQSSVDAPVLAVLAGLTRYAL